MTWLTSFNNKQGFTLIEVLIATFVVGTALVGVVGMLVLVLRTAQEGERRVAAVALANERAEMVRNLPYTEVGTVGGVPVGAIEQSETINRNNTEYIVRTDIRFVDDSFDGVAGGGGGEGGCVQLSHRPPGNPSSCSDLCVGAGAVNAHLAHGDSITEKCDGSPIVGEDDLNTDYKQVRIEVSWNSPNEPRPLLMLMIVAPSGVEGGELSGTLDFQVLDFQGQGVEGAVVQLANGEMDPVIDVTTQTNTEGRVVLPGLPAGDAYQLAVSKDGYTTEQTYTSTATFFPDLDHTHLTSLIGEVIEKTFFIDQVAEVTLQTVDEDLGSLPGIAYNWRGTKTVGIDELSEPVYKVNESGQTDASGEASYENLEWDSYDFTVDGETIGYDIKETSEILPVSLEPAEVMELTVTLVEHTPFSLQVNVTSPTGQPVDNATVRLSGNGVDEELGTGLVGQVFFADLPIAEEYSLQVDAPLYESSVQTVEVDGNSRVTISLTPT